MSKWQIFRQRDFNGGENRNILPELMQPNQLILAQNCVKNADGTIETRLGKSAINTTSLGDGPVLSVFRYAKEDGTLYLVAQHGTSLYSVEWDGSSVVSAFDSPAVKTGLTASAKLRGFVWKDNLILFNGLDAAFRFDGTTCTDLTGAPKIWYARVYANRIFGIDYDNPNFIRFSGLEDYDAWDALDVIKVRDGDGDKLTGLAVQQGGMVVFKNHSCYPLYGTSRDNIRGLEASPISLTIGCVAPDSIVDDGLCVGPDNLYKFSLTSIEPVGYTHRTVISSMTLAERQAAFAQPLYQQGRVIVNFGNSTILNVEATYGGILSWSGLSASCFASADAADDSGVLLIGDSTAGVIYQLTDTTNDAGLSITTDIKTAYSDFGIIRQKIWRRFLPEIEPLTTVTGIIYLKFDVDFEDISGLIGLDETGENALNWDVDNWDTSIWGASTRISQPYELHRAQGNRIAFGIVATDRIKFLGYITKYREVGYI